MNEPSVTLRPMTRGDYAATIALWRATPGIGLNDADTEANVASFLVRNPELSAVAFTENGKSRAMSTLRELRVRGARAFRAGR